VEAAGARRAAAEQGVEAMRNEVGAMVEELAIDTHREEEQLALVETGLLPQAEGAYAASRASYATGQGGLLELLDNQMNLYNLELQRLMLLAERGRSVAELEYMVGGPHSGGPHSGGPHSGGPHSGGPHSGGPLTAAPAGPEVDTSVE